jgi:DNA-binding MarR family transcriptional regulator
MSAAANTPGWATVSELANIRGVSIPAISKRVARLEATGALQTKPGPKGSKLVNVASFDRIASATEDGVRALNGRRSTSASPRSASASPVTPDAPVLIIEQARKTKADADLKELDRDERIGELVRADKVRDAIADALRMHKKVISQIAGRAEENAAAVKRDGVPGARAFLKRLENELLEDIADRAIEIARVESDIEGGNQHAPAQ